MHKFFLLVVTLTVSLGIKSFGQDTLPNISVKNINSKIVISWKNNYGAKINNINIQRSYDSLKNFTTIGTVLNPFNKENGYVDKKATGDNMFYRIFVAFEGGNYIFSRSHKPTVYLPQKPPVDTTQKTVKEIPKKDAKDAKEITDTIQSQEAIDTVQLKLFDFTEKFVLDTSLTNLGTIKETEPPPPAKLKDLIPARKFPVKPKPAGFVPSKFIYTNKDNNLILNLPDADTQNFSLRFFDDKDRLVFEIKKINEPYLIVEKVNFLHTGWFYYDLFSDGILLDKYKFYIAKDGRLGPPPPETKKTNTRASR
jgi:hypothetical protein